jgi:acetyl esterase/lipase
MAADFDWAVRIAARYNVAADIVYRTIDGVDVKLDVYRPFDNAVAKATLMFMHGGGWAPGSSKSTWSLWFLPFLQLDWVVVNVGYRDSSIARAPAAADDCMHALGWVAEHASEYQIDLKQLVISGLSAGGHLALLTGMSPCGSPGAALPRPAAIINWCGVTDVAEVVEGPHRQDFAVQWVGDAPNLRECVRAVSPLTHVRHGLPPIISLHGDQDDIVPYAHATRLHAALARAGVVNELITLPGAVHASLDAYLNAYPQIFGFLRRLGLPVDPG